MATGQHRALRPWWNSLLTVRSFSRETTNRRAGAHADGGAHADPAFVPVNAGDGSVYLCGD
jgi:hypothetical protein